MLESVDPFFWLGGTSNLTEMIMGKPERPPPPVGEVKHVEGSLEAQAEKEQKRRLKQAAAIMLKDWEPPVLGMPGMLGVSGT